MNKTITPFVFAAALLVAMLASTGIAHAQTVTYAPGQTAIEAGSFNIVTSGTQTLVGFTPLKAGIYTVVADGQTKTLTVTSDELGDDLGILFMFGDAVAGDAVLSFGGIEVARAPLDGPAIQPGSFEITYSAEGRTAIINWIPLKTGTYSVKLGARTLTRATVPSELGSPVDVEFGFGSATIAGTAVLSFGGVEVARQKVGTPRPTIHLRAPDDSAFADGANRITRTGVLVVLAEGFTAGVPPTGDTWEVSTNGGADYNHTLIKLPLRRPNVRVRLTREGSYTDNQVRARQTINRVRSPFAGLDAFIFDATPPEITLKGADRIVLGVGDTYTDPGATVTDNLDNDIQSKLMVGGDTVDTDTAGTYTVTYSATDHTEHALNTGMTTREVVVREALAFAAGGAPVFTSDGATVEGVTFAKAGDTLSLAFTTNLALASTPTVTIFVGTTGRAARVTQGASNAYIATYTVDEAHFSGSDGVAARYDIGAMAAAGDATNTLDPVEATSMVLLDVVAPVADFSRITVGVIGVEQSVVVTFVEPVTGLEASDFSGSTDLVVNDVSPVSGPGTTYTITFTPTAATFKFALASGSVTDRAGNVSNTLTRTVTNTPPTANAGPDQPDAVVGSPVTLDGSGSSDRETAKGDLIYFWSQLDGPDAVLSNDRVARPTFTPPRAGIYLFDLAVTDTGTPALGGTPTDTVIITAVEPPGISDLDGESGVSLDDAKFLYYAHALGSELDDPAVRTRVLGPLNTEAEADDLLRLLTAARGSLSVDLNNDEKTTAAEVAMLYYSFALEGSLGDGSDTKPGIPEIKRAILGPLAGTDDMEAINTMLQRVYELRGQ